MPEFFQQETTRNPIRSDHLVLIWDPRRLFVRDQTENFVCQRPIKKMNPNGHNPLQFFLICNNDFLPRSL